ncbi:MAG: alpha-amylase family glycosyl hydrolase [Chloroflexota bacterium]
MTEWWKSGIVYQIYPRSFQDTTGNGVGDIQGIIQRLDYLAWLGVDAIWISPFYPSPMADFGYDISDHCDIHPLFGNLTDLDELITEAHRKNLKIILDYVPNHTSEEHPWFVESKSSCHNPKRDWYIWRDAQPDGSPPNNWVSYFGGQSSWEWHEETQQYYLHSFLKEQPDVNWRHPEARKAMLDIIRFWYARGVDGIRVDATIVSMKDADFKDDPLNPDWIEGEDPFYRVLHVHSENVPEIHDYNRWLRQTNDEFDDRLLIGETYLNTADLVSYYGNGDEFHLPYNFQLITTAWNATAVKSLVDSYDAAMPDFAWPSWALGNHDRHRIATRVGADQASVAMTLLLTLRGTSTIYYGDEIGMENVPIPPEKEIDPWGILSPGLGLGRDPERTPMQWENSPNADFCEADVPPWLPLSADYASKNVQVQRYQPLSMLNITRTLLSLRKERPELGLGQYLALAGGEGVFAFGRQLDNRHCIIVLNMTADYQDWPLADGAQGLEVIYSNQEQYELQTAVLKLQPNQAIILG